MNSTIRRAFLLTCLLASVSCAHSSDEEFRICNFSINLRANGFKLLSHDEASCSAFVSISETNTEEGIISIIASNLPPEKALESIHGNFYATSKRKVNHRLPEPVSDDKNFYYVDNITYAGHEKHDAVDKTIIDIFEYHRAVTRIDQRGEEASAAQECVDLARYDDKSIVLLSGCSGQNQGNALKRRSLGLANSIRNID